MRVADEKELLEIRARMRGKPLPAPKIPEPSKPSKFNAVISEADGIKFRSKKERARYLALCALRSAGACWFLHQVPFYLPGGTKYVLDFLIFWKDGTYTFEDTKGFRTPAFIRNKKQVEALYPIKIEEG